MILSARAAVRILVRWAAAWACSALAACGWTARDQYLQNERSTVTAHAGDGSYLSSEWRAGPGRPLHSSEVASRFEDPR